MNGVMFNHRALSVGKEFLIENMSWYTLIILVRALCYIVFFSFIFIY